MGSESRRGDENMRKMKHTLAQMMSVNERWASAVNELHPSIRNQRPRVSESTLVEYRIQERSIGSSERKNPERPGFRRMHGAVASQMNML
jgi:hypothetical protein